MLLARNCFSHFLAFICLIRLSVVCSPTDSLRSPTERSDEQPRLTLSINASTLKPGLTSTGYRGANLTVINVDAGTDIQFGIKINTTFSISNLLFIWLKRSQLEKRFIGRSQAKTSVVLDHVLHEKPGKSTDTPSHEITSWTEEGAPQVIFRLTESRVRDSGLYKLSAETEDGSQHAGIAILIIVKGKPEVEIRNAQQFYVQGQNYSLSCDSFSHTAPCTWWQWHACKSPDACISDQASGGWIDDPGSKQLASSHPVRSIQLTERMNHTGMLRCISENEYGSSVADVFIHLTDAVDGFDLSISSSRVFVNDSVILTCRASAFRFGDNLTIDWFFEPSSSSRRARIKHHLSSNTSEIIERMTDLSLSSELRIANAKISDSGTYTCSCYGTKDGELPSDQHRVMKVLQPQPIKMLKTNLDSGSTTAFIGYSFEFNCLAISYPEAKVTWFKDGMEIRRNRSMHETIQISETNDTLSISDLSLDDSGQYECRVSNPRNESLIMMQELNVRVLTTLSFIAAHVTGTIVTVSIAFVVIMLIRRRIKKRNIRLEEERIKQELAELSFHLFQTDVVRSRYKIDPYVPLDEQVCNLQYDNHKWEIPRTRILMLDTLSRAFYGKLMKAAAIGLPGEPKASTTTVAVMKLKKGG